MNKEADNKKNSFLNMPTKLVDSVVGLINAAADALRKDAKLSDTKLDGMFKNLEKSRRTLRDLKDHDSPVSMIELQIKIIKNIQEAMLKEMERLGEAMVAG